MKILAPAVVLSLAVPFFMQGAAAADSTTVESGKIVISSESGVSTLQDTGLVETATEERLVKITKKSSGEETTEVVLDIRGSSTTSAVSADVHDKGVSYGVASSALSSIDSRYAEAAGDPKKIRELLNQQRKATVQDATINIEMLLAQRSDDKVETKKKAEEKKRLDAERKAEEAARKKAERDALEAALRAELMEEVNAGEVDLTAITNSLDTNSFNLQMGDEIDGDNTTRTGDGSSVNDGDTRSTIGDNIAEEAIKHIGASYVWGGESPTAGWDCSGFVQWLYAREGLSIPRVAIDQARFSEKVDNPVPGDLVLQNNGSHIGIYLGGGKMISAWNPDEGTMVHDVDVLPYEFYRVPGVLASPDDAKN